MEVKCNDLANMHETAIKYVSCYGKSFLTEDKEICIQADPIVLYCEKPYEGDRIAKWSGFKGEKLNNYVKDLLYGFSNGFAYTYHERIYEKPYDQVRYICDKLKNPSTRRAVIHTWLPEDATKNEVPCLQYIQFWVSGNKLNMYVLFRSNDVVSALGANAFALVDLFFRIACSCNYVMGSYYHSIICPHYYPLRDEDILENLRFKTKNRGISDDR